MAKEKNHVRVSTLIERLRGQRLDVLISRVDDASLGKNMKQPDWRAAAWLAQVIDRERYGDQRTIGTQVNNTNVTINALYLEAAKRVYGATVNQPAIQASDRTMKQITISPAESSTAPKE